MKKILLVLCLALLLVGCSGDGKDASISSNDTIWSSKDKTYTSKDLYSLLKTQDYTNIILNNALTVIAEKEEVDLETIKNDLKLEYKNYIDAGWGSYLASYYPDEDAYVNGQLTYKIEEELTKKSIDEEYESYVNEYKPYKAEVAYFDSEEVAKTVVDTVNAGKNTFAYAASENGYSTTINNEIYTKESDLPIEVKEAIDKVESKGLTEVVATSVTATDSNGNSTITPRYYVVNVNTKDDSEFKDEFITYVSNNYFEEKDLIKKYFTKYDVVIHDQSTYELLSSKYEGIKVK